MFNMDKVYCGNGKTISGTYGSFDALNLDVDTLLEHSYKAKNGKRYVNIMVSDRQNPDNYGNTKKITISKPPEKKPEVTANKHAPDRFQEELDHSDLPF